MIWVFLASPIDYGILTKIKQITRRGSIHILELTDDTSSIEISIQADYFEEVRHKLKLDEYYQILVGYGG